MLRWYYILWSDAINFTRSNRNLISIWKLHTLSFISLFMAINLVVISLLIKFEINTRFVTLFNSKALDNFLGVIIVYYFPPLIINYLLIFYNNQWEKIRKEYMHYNGKVYKAYYILSIVIPILFLLSFVLARDLFGFKW